MAALVPGEAVYLDLRDEDAVVWRLVEGDGDATPRAVGSDEEVGPASWWHAGGTWAQALNNRAQDPHDPTTVSVMATGVQSGLTSGWRPITIDAVRWPQVQVSIALDVVAGDASYLSVRGTAGPYTMAVVLHLYDEADTLLTSVTAWYDPIPGEPRDPGTAFEERVMLEPGWGDQLLRVEAEPYSAASIHGGVAGYTGPRDVKELYVAEADIIEPVRDFEAGPTAGAEAVGVGEDCDSPYSAGLNWYIDRFVTGDYVTVERVVTAGTVVGAMAEQDLGQVQGDSLMALPHEYVDANPAPDHYIDPSGELNTWHYVVRIRDSGGAVVAIETTGSISENLKSCAAPPAAPSGLAVSASGQELTTTWVDNAGDEEGQELQRDTSAGFGAPTTIPLGANVVEHIEGPLAEGVEYFYRARSWRTYGGVTYYSDWSNTDSATTAYSPPATPANFSVDLIGETSVSTSWDDVANETGYEWEYSTDPGMAGGTVVPLAADTTTHGENGLNDDTDYYVRLRAVRDLGGGSVLYSAWTATQHFKTLVMVGGGTPPEWTAATAGLPPVQAGNAQIPLTLDANEDDTDYEYRVSVVVTTTANANGNVDPVDHGNQTANLAPAVPASVQDAVVNTVWESTYQCDSLGGSGSVGMNSVEVEFTMELVKKSDGTVAASIVDSIVFYTNEPVPE